MNRKQLGLNDGGEWREKGEIQLIRAAGACSTGNLDPPMAEALSQF